MYWWVRSVFSHVTDRQGRPQGNGLKGPCGDCSPPSTCTCPDGSEQAVSMSSFSFSYFDFLATLFICCVFRCQLEMMSRSDSSLRCWTGIEKRALSDEQLKRSSFPLISRFQDVIFILPQSKQSLRSRGQCLVFMQWWQHFHSWVGKGLKKQSSSQSWSLLP